MKAIRKGDKIKVVIEDGDGYCYDLTGKTACELFNNGNGWDVKFPAHSSTRPTIRMNLDYDQLPLLIAAGAALKAREK